MRKIKKLLMVFVLIMAIAFALDGVNAYAKSRTTKSTSKRTSAKKIASTKSSSKKYVSKKSTSKKTTSKRTTYSRGSGRYLRSEDVQKVIDSAKRYLGVDYVFGGASPSGFDCSGFTMYVYKSVGVNLPHTASGQANLGVAVSKDELQAGDLVFFETYKSGISHVGIYIGDGKFIHASSGAGRVTITNLSDKYYTTRYRGATRILS
jgi:lipoprotein Spr